MILFPVGFWKSGLPPPPGWMPTDLASLAVWLNGADSESITVDGGNHLVRQTDLSGNGVDWIPKAGATAPTRITGALNGTALFRLNDTDAMQTDIGILPFGPGWGYNGPLVEAYALRFTIPNGTFESIPVLRSEPGGTEIAASESAGSNSLKGSTALDPALVGGPLFLSAAWPGPITTPSGTEVRAVILNFKGTTRNEAFVYWQTPASGSIPGYFSTRPITPFTHTLNALNVDPEFFAGTGQAGTELFIGEWFLSTEDSPAVSLETVRDYLLRWFGAIRPVAICQGDSLCGGFGIGQSLAWPYRCGLQVAGTDFLNVGINSRTLATLADDQPAYGSLIRPGTTNIVIIDAVSNDIANGASAATCIMRLIALASLWKALGCTVYVLDCIPRNFGAPFAGNPQDAAKEAERISYNTALAALSNANIDGIVSLSASSPFNNVNAWQNGAYYDPDETHLVAAGYQRKADLVYSSIFAE